MSDNPKERILTAATELFMRDGYTQMSVDDLARSLGMSKKTIYKHYTGKAALMDAVIEGFYADLNTKLVAVIASEQPYPQKLQTFLRTISESIAVASHLLIADLATVIPDVWQKIVVLRQQTIEAQAQRIIQIGIEEGIVRADINPELFYLIVQASVERATEPQRLMQTGESPDKVFRQVMDIFFNGVLKK